MKKISKILRATFSESDKGDNYNEYYDHDDDDNYNEYYDHDDDGDYDNGDFQVAPNCSKLIKIMC